MGATAVGLSDAASATLPPVGDDGPTPEFVLVALGLLPPRETRAFLVGNEVEVTPAYDRCVGDRGFRYFPPSQRGVVLASSPIVAMDSADYAATYGFGIAQMYLAPDPPLSGYEQYVMSLTAEEMASYDDAVADCRDEIEGISLAQLDERSAAASAAVAEFRGMVHADQRAVDALEEWRECVGSGGYDFDSPGQMRAGLMERASVATPEGLPILQAEEVRVAVVNAPCEQNYLAVIGGVVRDRFDEFFAMYSSILNADTSAESLPDPPSTDR